MDYLENPLMVYIYILEIIEPSLNPLRVYILYPLDTRKKQWFIRVGFLYLLGQQLSCERQVELLKGSLKYKIMLVKQCHKPSIFLWFIPVIYGDSGDGLLLCNQIYNMYIFLIDSP